MLEVASFGLKPPEVAARVIVMGEAASTRGRSLAAIRRAFLWAPWVGGFDPWSSVEAFADVVGRSRGAGVTDFVFDEPQLAQWKVLERVASIVLPRLRGRDDT
ncbi:MAG TPA: hypothetical protein VH482_21620 [Thermomicrobiales bacterium]|jgi:hypothetical protein